MNKEAYKLLHSTKEFNIYLVKRGNNKQIIKENKHNRKYISLIDNIESIKTNSMSNIINNGGKLNLYNLDFSKKLASDINYEFTVNNIDVYTYIKDGKKVHLEFGDRTMVIGMIPLENKIIGV